jgi:hypothetical protein
MSVKVGASDPGNCDEIERFYLVATAAFERAFAAPSGGTSSCYSIGGRTLRLRIAGAVLPGMATALRHLEIEPVAEADLRIDIFESESTGVSMPPPAWSTDDYGAGGDIRGFNDDRWRTVYDPGSCVLQLYDRVRRHGIYWSADTAAIPRGDFLNPLRPYFGWWTKGTPLQLVHAGAVGTASGGVLIAGSSGSGKSTTSLACLQSDLLHAGDDHVVVQTEPRFFVHSLYSSAMVESTSLQLLPHLESFIHPTLKSSRQKSVLFLNETHPASICRGFPLSAILAPRVTGGNDVRLTRLSTMEAMLILAPSSVRHAHRRPDAETIRKLSAIVRSTPAYRLDVGRDLSAIPSVIATLLKGDQVR